MNSLIKQVEMSFGSCVVAMESSLETNYSDPAYTALLERLHDTIFAMYLYNKSDQDNTPDLIEKNKKLCIILNLASVYIKQPDDNGETPSKILNLRRSFSKLYLIPEDECSLSVIRKITNELPEHHYPEVRLGCIAAINMIFASFPGKDKDAEIIDRLIHSASELETLYLFGLLGRHRK